MSIEETLLPRKMDGSIDFPQMIKTLIGLGLSITIVMKVIEFVKRKV